MSTPVETPARPQPGPATPHRPHRAVVVGVGLLTVLGLATAVTLPVVLDDRGTTAATAMRGRLEQVAAAQDAWRTEHGTYTTRLADLGLADREGDVAIVQADEDSFCVGAYDGRTRTSLFYSVPGSLSTGACTGVEPDE